MSEGTWKDGKPVPYATPVDKVETRPTLVGPDGQTVRAPAFNQAELNAKGNELLKAIGHWPLDIAIVVIGNILGHLIAMKCNNTPGRIDEVVKRVALGLKASALSKMIHDDEKRRKG